MLRIKRWRVSVVFDEEKHDDGDEMQIFRSIPWFSKHTEDRGLWPC